MPAVGNLTRASRRPEGGPLRVLCFATHERYESSLSLTGHEFYSIDRPGCKKWNPLYAAVPENYHILPESRLPKELDFDLVLSQEKFSQYPHAANLARRLHLPLLSLEHTMPMPDWPQARVSHLGAMRGDVNVFISDYSRRLWGFEEQEGLVIRHGIDCGLFRPRGPRKAKLLSVVNEWASRDLPCGYTLWREATAGLPVRVVGLNPGLSEPARDVDELAEEYASALVFVNTSQHSPIPTALLEAMASGCAVVTTPNPAILEAVEDGVSGLVAADAASIRAAATRLLKDHDLALRLGQAARKSVTANYGLAAFVRNWDAALKSAADRVFTGKGW